LIFLSLFFLALIAVVLYKYLYHDPRYPEEHEEREKVLGIERESSGIRETERGRGRGRGRYQLVDSTGVEMGPSSSTYYQHQ
jgi:hypothetical protein